MTAPAPEKRRGFTLIELMIVMLLIGIIATMAAPRLLPVLTITEHESEARHLVGFGRMAMSHAALTRTPIRVRIDLDNQEYWAEEMPVLIEDMSPEGGYDEDEELEEGVPENEYELEQTTKQILRDNMKKDEKFSARLNNRDNDDDASATDDLDELDPQYRDEEKRQNVLDKQKEKMEEAFRAMADNSLYARALRVNHDDEWKDKDRFDLQRYREEELEEEDLAKPINDAMLSPHEVIETVWIDTVIIGDEEYSKGVVDVELTPLGLETDVTFAVFNEEGDLFMVYWDPMSGNAWYSSAEPVQ